MRFSILVLLISLIFFSVETLWSQTGGDLNRSVPAFFAYDETSGHGILKWTLDPSADQYIIYSNETPGENNLIIEAVLPGTQDSFVIPDFAKTEITEYVLDKRINGSTVGLGSINVGVEIPIVHSRGNVLILIEESLRVPLSMEINRWIRDLEGDGWSVGTRDISKTSAVVNVKNEIQNWFTGRGGPHNSLILLGNIPVPYSGNIAPDGHGDHVGAWACDGYYGDLDGVWTDNTVNNVTASRDANKNIPGDGKFDQSIFPSSIELEVGRIDLSDLPAFGLDEIELTRKYLNKNHDFRNKNFDMPMRAVIENNFLSFAEGFGQNGFNNFTPMFGPDQVAYGNYDEVLKTEDYLCAYACGPGSYRSAGGIGTTANLYAAHELNTVFAMNFGSYFGDWDISDNFLRAALGSGKILTNSWAGRPNWHIIHMALGKHIGYSTAISQYNNLYPTGFSGRSVHVALLGDPTLRLHSVAPPTNVTAVLEDEQPKISWTASPDADYGYIVYRRGGGSGGFQVVAQNINDTEFKDQCLLESGYTYIVKAIKLEQSASGSYFNTSIGKQIHIEVNESGLPRSSFSYSANWEEVSFINLSNSFSEGFSWEFGDENFSSEENPVHRYAEGGSYEVCLYAYEEKCNRGDAYCTTIEVMSSSPKVDSVLITKPLCYGDSNGGIEILWSGGDGSPTFEWSDSGTGSSRMDLMAGDYELTISSTTGREEIYNYSLDQPDSLSVVITTTPSTGADGVAIVDVNGGTAPYDIDWGDAIIDTTAFAPGDYEVIVYDANGCARRLMFTIDMATSLFESHKEGSVLIYPNPTYNQATVISDEGIEGLQILRSDGRVWRAKRSYSNQKRIVLNGLNAKGVFFVELYTSSGKIVEKIIIE